jgi:hypothetical protein
VGGQIGKIVLDTATCTATVPFTHLSHAQNAIAKGTLTPHKQVLQLFLMSPLNASSSSAATAASSSSAAAFVVSVDSGTPSTPAFAMPADDDADVGINDAEDAVPVEEVCMHRSSSIIWCGCL